MEYQQLQDEIKAAMKARDNHRRDILRQVHTELKAIEVNERREVTEADVDAMLKRVIKQTKETLDGSIKAGNNQERTDTLTPLPLLTLDRFGPPEGLDGLLDRLAGMSRALLCAQQPHAVLWLDGAGEPQLHPVADEREYRLMLTALLTGPAPLSGPALDDFPELLCGPDGPAFRVHIALEGGDGHG